MADGGQDVDITDRLPENIRDDIRVIAEDDRLRFAKQVLLYVGALCVLVFAAYVRYPDNHALTNIFELIKIGVLPLVTLVVSFYFPKMER